MNFGDRQYPAIVRDLLTVLTGGTAAEPHAIGAQPPDVVSLDNPPVRRISYLAGKILVKGELADYRFTERDFELVAMDQNPNQYSGLRFRPKAPRPAPNSILTVNYYPERLRPTPLTDINVGSVVRTLLETVSRELATQYQQLQMVYESAFVETAKGDSLDKVVALVDTARLKQGQAVGKVRFSRRSGSAGEVNIPISTAVSDGSGNRYLASAAATLLANQASVEVWVHGETALTKPVDAAKLTVLDRAIAGVDRVTNDEPTYRATEDETDAQLSERARRAIHATGKGTRDALRYGLEALECVSGATLTEYPDPAVLAPGILRADIALSVDNQLNRRMVDLRIEELRPAGIYVDRNWAGRVTLAFAVDLVLAGSPLPTSSVADVEDGVALRLTGYAQGLGPAAILRRAQLVSLAMQDARVVDAKIAVTSDGAPVSGDTYTLPTGKTATLDSSAPVTFGTVTFEQAGPAQPPVIQVDADLAVASMAVTQPALEASRKAALGAFLAGLAANAAITFDQIATALRDDTDYALVRSQSVIAFDQEGGGFTELRDNDPAYIVPAGSTFKVRNVRITQVNA